MNATTDLSSILSDVASPASILAARRQSVCVKVGNIGVGGNEPVRIQSMTNTDTANVEATVEQVKQLAAAGSEIVRITVDRAEAAAAVPKIVDRLRTQNCNVPIVGDFHYNGHTLLRNEPACAKMLDKFRVNPGNVGFGEKRDRQFEAIVLLALQHEKPLRIGVNWGSLDQRLLADLMDTNAASTQPKPSEDVTIAAIVQSALQSAAAAEQYGMGANQIVISAKVSELRNLIAVYRMLASRCSYALHVGLTEAGMGLGGLVSSSSAIAILLAEGIGDTIRASLTPKAGESRTREVETCRQILQSLGLRRFTPSVTACPGCGRTTSSYFQELTANVQAGLADRMQQWSIERPSAVDLHVAVMGCIVNGPGESKRADIGISLPGTGESPVAPVYVDGEKVATLRGDGILNEFMSIIDNYVETRYPQA